MKSSSRDRKACSPTLREYLERYNFRKNLKRSKSKKSHSHNSPSKAFKHKIQEIKVFFQENISEQAIRREFTHRLDELSELFQKAINQVKSFYANAAELTETIQFNHHEKQAEKLIPMPHLQFKNSMQTQSKLPTSVHLDDVKEESLVLHSDEFTSIAKKEKKKQVAIQNEDPQKKEVGQKNRGGKRGFKPDRLRQK